MPGTHRAENYKVEDVMMSNILPAGKVLVVDDEQIMRESLAGWLQEDGLEVITAESGAQALQIIARETFDLMLVDLKMPGMSGLDFLKKAKEIQPQTPVIIMTAYATVDTAVQAMKDGAEDYITKPFIPDEVSMTIHKILQSQSLVRENIQLRLQISKQYDYHNIISNNLQMQKILDLIPQIADSPSPVLIQGERGTGKELIAKAIHFNSNRASQSFISVPCAGLPDSLLKIDLFGREKGAIAGAKSFRKGKLEIAHGGTLFLDEVGALSAALQPELLSILQEKEFMRLRGEKCIHVDIRVISATSRDLWKGVQEGWFREDLYYRINAIPIILPPLRERKEDIPLLVEHFIAKYNVIDARKVKGINEEALCFMLKYHWPGNIRELENVVERAILVNNTGVITPADLPPHLIHSASNQTKPIYSLSLQEVERRYIAWILKKNNWNIKKTAELLQIDRSTLYEKIKKYNLSPESFSGKS